MNFTMGSTIFDIIILDLIAIGLLSTIFFFVFKAAIKDALKEIVREIILTELKEYEHIKEDSRSN